MNRREPPSFVQLELLYARQPQINKPIFPVRVTDCALPLIIQDYTYTDFFPETIYGAGLDILSAEARVAPKPPMRRRDDDH